MSRVTKGTEMNEREKKKKFMQATSRQPNHKKKQVQILTVLFTLNNTTRITGDQ
jgi:hypothetical protein